MTTPDRTPPPIAVQLYSLRDQAEADGLRSVLERVAAIGYQGVESAGFHDLTPAEFATTCADLGLTLASAHIGMLGDDDDLAITLDSMAETGFDTVVIPVLWPDDFATAASVDAAADRLSHAAEMATDRGLALGYHNHFWEFTDVGGEPALSRLFRQCDQRVFAELDIYWTQVGGVDPAGFVAGLGDRARLIHVKDGPAADHDAAMVAVGAGAIDVSSVLAAAADARWHLVELDRCDTDMFEAVAASFEYLVGHGLSAARPTSSATRVALVGCGVIAPAYLRTLAEFSTIEVAACVDGVADRAEALAETCGARAASFDEVLADSSITCIVNLTPPLAHLAVSGAALRAGKAVFSEKPLGVAFDDGVELVALARDRGARLGCAPDTFMGAGLQTARAAIDRGDIGTPIGAAGFMLSSGPEWWHPDPAFFYARGAGPLLDMGPYYLTTLVHLLGPARSVMASARITHAQRRISSQPRAGTSIDVEVPTHVSGLIDFESGATATLTTSFDVQASRLRNIEIYGTEATLSVPDPNTFGGPVEIRVFGERDWRELPLVEPTIPQARGVGLADMVWASRSGRPHRAAADVALHVLELTSAMVTSSDDGRHVELTTTCVRPAPLPVGLATNTFDD